MAYKSNFMKELSNGKPVTADTAATGNFKSKFMQSGQNLNVDVSAYAPKKMDTSNLDYTSALTVQNALEKLTMQNAVQTPDVNALTADYMAARKAEDDAWNAFNQYNNSTHFTQVDQNVLDGLNRNIMDTTKAREAAEEALKNADPLAYNNAYSKAKYANATGVEATGVGKGIMSIGKTITSAPGVIAETAKSAVKGEDIDMSSDAMRNMGEAMYLKNAATENAGTVGRFLGNTALSIGQNMALLPMNAAVPGSSLVAMGAISAADKMYELGAQGTGAKEALLRGAVSGAIEGLTEKLPLDTLSAMIKSGGKSVAKNLLKQAGVEATEEGVAYFANWVADKLAKDPNATWSWDEFTQSVASGGLSGLFFGLGGTVIGGVNGETAENGENRPTTPTNDTTPTSPLSEQKTAPNAVNGAEAVNNEASNQHPVLANGPTSTPKSAGAAKLASPATTVSQSEPVVNSGDTESVGAAPSGFDPYSNMIAEYGIIPEGENPARMVDLPKSTNGKDRVSYTARTAMEAEATPDSAVGELGEAILNGEFSYIPISNKQAEAAARATLKKSGDFSTALANWTAEVRQGKTSAKLTAMGALLYNESVNSGNTKQAMSILADYAAMVRHGAQAVQAARILKTLSPENKLLFIQESVNKINEANQEKAGRKIGPKDNVPVKEWMQRVGDDLAKSLASRASVSEDNAKTVSQEILNDLKSYANTVIKKSKTFKSKTPEAKFFDLLNNWTKYSEAIDVARNAIQEKFADNPDALAVFNDWLNSSANSMLVSTTGSEGDIVVDEAYINEYLNAKTDEARDAALDKIYQNIADQIPSNLMDKFTALRYLNMLGNLKTQGRNILGNLINKGVRAVDHRLEAVFQAIYHHNDPSKRTTTFFRDPEIAKMAKADFENYRDVVMGEQKYSVSAPSGKLADEIESRRTIFKSNGNWGTSEATGIAGSPPARVARWGMDKVANPFFEGYRKLTSLAMDKGDEIFSKSAYADAMSRYLKAKGFTAEQWENGSIPQETLDAARQYSIKEAQEATFRDSNAFSDAISKVGFKNPQNGVQKAINVGVQGTIPFKKTPANVAVQAEKHSPLGLVNTAVNAVRASNSNDVDANDVIKSLSETLTGSGLVLLGGALAAAGFATGRKEEDEKLAQIDDLTGGQEYAIVIPGVGSYTYDSLTPASMSFALGVEAYKAFERNGFTPSAFFEAVSGATDIMLNMSMLSGLNDAFENVSYSDTPLVDAALNSVASYFTQGLTSTLGGQIERIFEEERMTTFRDKNSNLSTSAQYSLGKTSAKTPGWDFQQIPYIDAWGRTEDSGSTVFRAFSNLLSPGYASKENATEADEEIRRLAEAGYTGAVPSNVEFSKKVDGEYMNSEQYTEYATVKGQTSFDLVSDMILSTVYKGMTDEEKADSIAKAYAYAGHVAAEEITDGKHESEKYVELAQEAQKDLGLSEAEYLLYYMKYGGTIMNGDAIRKAYDMGIEVGDYAEFAAGKSKYDADGNSSYTNAEKLKAVEESGFTGEALTALYMITFPDWVNGAAKKGVDFMRYVEYKKATNGASKKADKIDALIAAGYNPVQANQMYKEME